MHKIDSWAQTFKNKSEYQYAEKEKKGDESFALSAVKNEQDLGLSEKVISDNKTSKKA